MAEHNLSPTVVKFFRLLTEHTDITVEEFFSMAMEHGHDGECSAEEVIKTVEEWAPAAVDHCIVWGDCPRGSDEMYYFNNRIEEAWLDE